MKKLSLLLFAFCVSVMSYGDNDSSAPYTLNPYAYDLSSSWDSATKKLTVNFKLNAAPNLKNEDNPSYAEPRGIQIYAVDSKGKEYRIYGPSEATIKAAGNKGKGPYSFEIDLSAKKATNGESIPEDEVLTWKVVVKGKSNRSTTMTCTNAGWRPCHTHGVAVSKNQESKHFGKVFVSEFSDAKPSGWEWLTSSKVPGLLEYDPIKLTSTTTADQAVGHKGGTGLEPHRVRISEDGRIFVTSYPYASSPSATGTSTAVWELVDGTYRPIITCDANGTGRVVAMDVKGSGSNLKMLVCEVIPYQARYSNSSEWHGQLRIREYSIGTSTASQDITNGSQIITYNDYRSGTIYAGMIYQAYKGGWPMAQKGMVNIAYGAGNAIWLKLAFGSSQVRQRIVYFDRTNNCSTYYDTGDDQSFTGMRATKLTDTYVTGMLGGDGLLIQGDTLITAGIDKVYLFKIGSGGTLSSLTNVSTISGTFHATNSWVNDFAIDPAHNLYAVSADPSGAKNLMVVSLPYSGAVTTYAPAGNTFTLTDPVPNIYATNLRYEAVEGAPKYKFSFNVNTEPKYAEIRFYKSYESMKKSMLAVNADDFKGGKTTRDNDLYCYYPISGLKQGKIEVEFGMVGGIINQQTKELTNARLPRGELYWSVYVETDKSSVFAPIYRQPLTGTDAHYRLHATVNNYPETDQFGAVYAAQEDKRDASNNKRSSLMIYEINDNGGDVHDLNNTTRYQKTHEYLYATGSNPDKAFPRRMTVAPDGLLYIAHQGDENKNVSSVAEWKYGGIYTWNPNDAVDANGKIKLSLFSYNEIGTSTAVVLYPLVNGNDTTWKLYATNTYNEYGTHGQYYDTVAAANINKFGWNGFVEYVKDKNLNWTAWNNINTPTNKYQLGRGDESGNVSLAATDYGMWLCQYREHNVEVKKNIKEPYADNKGAYVLSFVPYGQYSNSSYAYGPRTWRSCTTDGGRVVINSTVTTKNEAISDNSQTETAPLQSTPGGGMTYKKVKISDTQFNEYLYVVNHDGDIVQWKIEWADNNTRPRMHINNESLKILKTPTETKGVLRVVPTKVGGITTDWTTAAITSMCFDFAGNLVTTTGVSYFDMDQLQNEASELAPEGGQSIIIYTMPYDRTNAREIQAPKSNIFIPERLAQLNMTDEDIQKILTEHNDHGSQCYIDLYRPMQGGMFNTFCVPFELNTTLIPTDHPLYGAEIRRFTGVTLSESGGENILTLNFENLINNTMAANVPHIINPKSNIKSIIPFDWLQVLAKNTEVESPYFDFDNGNRITYQGILPKTQVDALYDPTTNLPLRLILVADNRLAVLTGDGDMYGFRGYFDLARPLTPGTVAKISAKKDTPTNTTIVVDGKKVNIDKYLREGRVYIRVGDSLYTVDGQLVK